MVFEKYPLWELNINSEGLLMVEINVQEQIFQSAETLSEFWKKPVVQREDFRKKLSFCSLMLAKTIWNDISFSTAKNKFRKNNALNDQKCRHKWLYFSEVWIPPVWETLKLALWAQFKADAKSGNTSL